MRRFAPSIMNASLRSSVSTVAATTVSVCCAPVLAGRLFSSRSARGMMSATSLSSSTVTAAAASMRRVSQGKNGGITTTRTSYLNCPTGTTTGAKRFFSSTGTRRAPAGGGENNTKKPRKPMNPFKVLGLKPSASEAEIKKAYRVLAKKNHPDLGGNPEKFMQIREAYDLVKDGNYVHTVVDRPDSYSKAGKPRWETIYYRDGNSGDVLSADKVKDMFRKGKSFAWDFPNKGAGETPGSSSTNRGNVGGGKRSNILAEQYNAWYRLVVIWSGFLVTARVALFAMFPPDFKFMPQHANLSEEERVAIQARQRKRVAPPKPLAQKRATPPSAAQLFGRPIPA